MHTTRKDGAQGFHERQDGTWGRNTPSCNLAPAGWRCTREPGHSGPCAAQPEEDQSKALEAIDSAFREWVGNKRPPARAAFHAGAVWMAQRLAPHIAGVRVRCQREGAPADADESGGRRG